MSQANKFSRFVVRFFALIGVLVTALGAMVLLSLVVRCSTEERVVAGTVLELELEGSLTEAGSDNPLRQVLGRSGPSLRDVVDALRKAKTDDRIQGVIAHVGGSTHGMARTQELRDAILDFRESGKFAIAYAETFGELAAGNQGYYLATAFDEIWMQPTGAVGLTGLLAESMFVKGTLEKLEIEPQGGQRKEYKNAYNMFTERRFTPAHKEATQAVLGDHFDQMVAGIATGRDIPADRVRTLIDEGPFLGKEALEFELVDGLAYRDEVWAKLRDRVGGDETHFLFARKYVERAGRPHREGRKIAIIRGLGTVTRGSSSFDPLSGETSMGSDTITAALRAAIDDEDIEAIVFRVDSPGGSAVASDAIWRETVRAKEKGKPLIVSMGNVAGSGGYYVACAATKIVAQPGTITGSIGVLGGKPYTREFWNEIGVTYDSVQSSDNAEMFSTTHPYDEKARARLEAWLDFVYADFKQRVARGRGMTEEQVEAVAKGRIWSGARAKELGLVDELGGLERAIEIAKREAGIAIDESIELVLFPPEKGWAERLFEEGPDSSEDRYRRAEAHIETGLERWRPLAKKLRAVGLGPDPGGVLTMPSMQVGP